MQTKDATNQIARMIMSRPWAPRCKKMRGEDGEVLVMMSLVKYIVMMMIDAYWDMHIEYNVV